MWSVFGQPLDRIKWRNVVFIVWLHVFAVYSFIHAINNDVKRQTLQYLSLILLISGLGMSVGGHRYITHRSFKARLPLRVLLMASYSSVLNGSALSYARDHRAHHKWTDRAPDPADASRGMFFAHFGWWLIKKDKIVLEWGKKLDMKDLRNDRLVMNQHQYYPLWALIFGFILPTLAPVLLWDENLYTAFLLCVPYKSFVVLHCYWTANSLSHWLGRKPYIKNSLATDNDILNYLLLGEGDHNFHHAFAHDYMGSELSMSVRYNPTTLAIDLLAFVGLAYDRKVASKEEIKGRVMRSGDVNEWHRYHCHSGLMYSLIDWALGIAVENVPVYGIVLVKTLTFA